MIQAIAGLFRGIFGILAGLLPDSPFSSYLQVTETMQLGIGWLNWFLPINHFVAILFLWIAAGAIVAAVKWAVGETVGLGMSKL